MNKKLTIAVSGINAVDNPGPGTGIIRALKESSLDVRTIGLAYDTLEPGIYLDDIVDKTYIMPYPSVSKEIFLERIAYIHSKEKIDVIISALDAELPVFIDIKNQLEIMGIKMLIPNKEMFKVRDKSHLKSLGEKIGINIPEYKICTSFEDLYKAIEILDFPVMIKGPFYEAKKASSMLEAEKQFRLISAKWGFPIIVQKFIVAEEYNVVGCGIGDGNNIGLFAMKKMTRTSIGKVWNAVSIKNEKLIELTKKMVSELKWCGGFEFEVMFEPEEQEFYLIEINPRFPAWVYFASACGINLPERMVQYLTNIEYDSDSDYKSGKLMIRYTTEIIKDISDFEQITINGELSKPKIK